MNTGAFRLVALLAILVLGTACGDDPPGGGNGDGGTNQNQNQPQLIGVPGVTITEVAVYQGPKCTIMSGGMARVCDVPLINGRDALVRVFYQAEPSMVGQTVLGRLSIDADHTYEVGVNLGPESSEENLMSTVNFVVPGVAVNQFLSYQVGLLQEGLPANDNPAARFPVQGVQPVTVDGIINTFRVILAPFAYCADGSCRVPNLGPAEVEAYRQRFLQLYPVTNVEVTLRDAYNWNSAIGPDGSGWQQVGMTLAGFRGADGESADVYYYGIFNPAASLYSFCGGGCLLGVTLLNSSPPAEGNPQMRFALGVGFDEVGMDTAAHELGHAHGLEHVNCGYGLDPNSIDYNYPHNANSIGVWSWDIVNETLIDPDTKTDIMGYCDDQWISDYHYNKLYDRAAWVNMPLWHLPGPQVPYRIVSVDGMGGGMINDAVMYSSHEIKGQAVQVLTHTLDGARSVTGQAFHWDHLPGGLVFVPEQQSPIERAELTVRGVHTVAELLVLPH